jgi:chemotaxis protein methyltransferase CheR
MSFSPPSGHTGVAAATSATARLDALAESSVDLDYIRNVIREHSAIVVDETKSYLITTRLAPVMKRHGLASLRDLVHRLRTSSLGGLRDEVVDAMTTNETLWFRDTHPFDALRAGVLPELIQHRRAEKELTIWSAACSSGQEPYTIAMLLREHFPQLIDWRVRICATDLSSEMLARAAAGRYSQTEMNRGMPAALLVKYFQRVGAEWQVVEPIRSTVEFRTLNLARPWPYVTPSDVVFLRNVLIYFDMETKRSILDRVRSVLRPGGVLFLGSAETTLGVHAGFAPQRHGTTTVYRAQ